MTPHRLPGRIAAVMAGTVAVFVLTVGVSVLWMTQALDRQGRENSVQLVETALASLESQMLTTTLDYAKWDEAARRVAAADLGWLYENMGLAAASGVAANLVVLWGGPFAADVGWLDQSPPAGMSRLLGAQAMGMAEVALRGVPLDAQEGVAFFAWRGSDLFVVAAARVEPTLEPGLARDAGGRARLLMGRRVTREEVAAIARGTLLEGLRIDRRAPGDRPSATVLGGDGAAVAWLTWDAPRPGTALLGRMLPPLIAVTALAAGLALAGMAVARRGAHDLVAAEHLASAAARTDPLTGLPNRAAFGAALERPARAGERAILFLDVNGFKRINDSIGHAAGDQVIRHLALRLGTLAGSDCLLARIGGDEFVFVVEGPDAEFRTEWLAHAVERLLAQPFDVQGHQMRLRAAMGHAVQGADLSDGDALVRQADLAMYAAKRHKERGPVAFSALIEQAAQDAQAIERGLRAALGRPGELFIAYQPIVSAATGRMERAEALARWTSPDLGPVPPDRFIAVAEQSGLIVELGRRLFALVCEDLAAQPALRVAVNISALQLMAPDFIPDLVALLRSQGVDPARIEVELTESMVVDDPGLAAQRLAELHAAGFSTALDDFGSGYSSIGTLRAMSFDTLKIDRSFVSGLGAPGGGAAGADAPGAEASDGGTAPERRALVAAMVLLAQALRLRVVCEGVETEAEMSAVRELGCELVQGYLIDRPLPMAALAARWLGGAEARAAVA